jgi:Family of unknown function (DUF5985)
MISMATFFSGFTMATFSACALFFFKFWRASRDRFFFFFGLTCFLLSLERFASLLYSPLTASGDQLTESGIYVYMIRLAAFVMLLVGIWEKNRSPMIR